MWLRVMTFSISSWYFSEGVIIYFCLYYAVDFFNLFWSVLKWLRVMSTRDSGWEHVTPRVRSRIFRWYHATIDENTWLGWYHVTLGVPRDSEWQHVTIGYYCGREDKFLTRPLWVLRRLRTHGYGWGWERMTLGENENTWLKMRTRNFRWYHVTLVRTRKPWWQHVTPSGNT